MSGVDVPALKAALAALPSSAADPDLLQKLGRRARKAIAAGQLGSALRIRVVSSFLTDMLIDALTASMLRRGVVALFDPAPFGALPLELIGGTTPPCDMLMVLPTHRDLRHTADPFADRSEARAAATTEAGFWAGLWPAGVPVVQLSFDPPPTRPLAEADGLKPGGRLYHVRATNEALADSARTDVAVVDAEALAGAIGPGWHDARTYALCKQPFANSAMCEVSEALSAAAAGLLGKARKVVVLDLDNTVWGGVIGDVGLEGLVLGMETAEGEAFVALQRHAKSLSRRGIILAVCSKNNEAIARSAFGGHSGMVLTADDIACFVANFDDKATNIRLIAKSLNVGLDSLVFVDDNPIERAWVKSQLPEVLVVDLPQEPAAYVAAIEAARAFPMTRLTAEDVNRSASYQARARLVEAEQSSGDMDSFLAGLDSRVDVSPLLAHNSDRIVQLIGKTNQFKLNPALFTADALRTGEWSVTALSLSDRLQDYGIVAVSVARPQDGTFVVAQWVMSCRVFSRRLEHVMLELLSRDARQAGCATIRLDFTPSPKNGVARDYLLALGFNDTGSGLVIDTDRAPDAPHHMMIKDIAA